MPDRDALSRRSKPIVVGIGELLWDLLPTGKALGGAPANFCYHAQALGAEAIIVSCIGRDLEGDEAIYRLTSLGLTTAYIGRDEARPTGTVSVSLDAAGKPSYVIHENVAWDYIPGTPEILALASRTDAVCFGTLAQRSEVSRSTIRSFLKATRPQTIRLLDLNLRQTFYDRKIIEDSLHMATVLKLSDDELPVLAGLLSLEGDPLSLVEELGRRYRLKIVALTKGAKGSLLYAEDRFFAHHGYAVDVVDTVGAGDAFAAALALGLLEGRDFDAINEKANRLAAFVCSQAGAMPLIPEEILQDE